MQQPSKEMVEHTHTAPALTLGWSKGVICHISEPCHTARATSDL